MESRESRVESRKAGCRQQTVESAHVRDARSTNSLAWRIALTGNRFSAASAHSAVCCYSLSFMGCCSLTAESAENAEKITTELDGTHPRLVESRESRDESRGEKGRY